VNALFLSPLLLHLFEGDLGPLPRLNLPRFRSDEALNTLLPSCLKSFPPPPPPPFHLKVTCQIPGAGKFPHGL